MSKLLHSTIWCAFLLGATPVMANPKIADGAVMEITRQHYPQTYAEWGADGVRRINELAPLAAERAASSPACNRVELVELSGQRSVAPTKIVFFVDCANGKRFYIDEKQLSSTARPRSQTEKTASVTDAAAVATCEAEIKAKLTNPLSFDRAALTTSVYRAPTTGNVVVRFEFEAQNDIGNVLRRKAHCVITDRGLESAEVLRS